MSKKKNIDYTPDPLPEFLKIDEIGFKQACKNVLSDQLELIKTGKHKLHIARWDDKNKLQLHQMRFHTRHELFIQISGYTDFSCPDEEFRVGPGEICVIPRNVPHKEFVDNLEKRFCNLVILPRQEIMEYHFATMIPPINFPHNYILENYPLENVKPKEGFLDDLVEAYYTYEVNRDAVVTGLLHAHFCYLLELLEYDVSYSRKILKPKVSQCKQLIDKYLSDPELSVNKLADMLQCSPNHLSSLFNNELNVKITDYINSERIRHACKLLEETTMDINEVAWSCGFNRTSYFCRVFKRRTMYSPLKYRRYYQS